jgi:hypothetical protein
MSLQLVEGRKLCDGLFLGRSAHMISKGPSGVLPRFSINQDAIRLPPLSVFAC